MICRKCKIEIPDGSRYCNQCGAKQSVAQNPKRRGNGQGSVYQLPNKSWIAVKVLGYELSADGQRKRKRTVSKSGFKTKKDAVDYLGRLGTEQRFKPMKFKDVYDLWLPTHRAGASTISCYKAAIKYFQPVWYLNIADISIDDLQDCLDDCTKGRRTKENMKAMCGLVYKYSIPRHFVPSGLNMAQYLIVSGDSGNKDALPDSALSALEKAAWTVPWADYVLCQCYLGFRPSEFLALDAADYNRKEKALVGGAKTEAGKDRIVTVSPKIQAFVDRLVKDKISGPIFCGSDGGPLDIKSYREIFYSVLEQCGIENPIEERDGVKFHKYTPHSCRHTFATLMKRVPGADKDKLSLIGHTSAEMLRHYQDVCYDDLRKITNAL